MKVQIEHFAEHPDVGTFGQLHIPGEDAWSCYTVELPYRDNQRNVSRIPCGVYSLGKRRSGVVKRASVGEFKRGWHVRKVAGRKYIMVHPGNTVGDLDGCIAVGNDLGYVRGKWAVINSRVTFREFMERMERLRSKKSTQDELFLEIRNR